MQVNDTRKNDNTLFELVEPGEVFCWEGKPWMRTRPCKVGDTVCNAVDISDGMLVYFQNSNLVEKLNAELTIH